MPGISGIDAAQQVCRLHPEARLLFISGYPARAHSTDRNVTVLYKPFSRAVFVQKVREVLDQRPAVVAAAAP
jgi:two-component SAPR family response regulator